MKFASILSVAAYAATCLADNPPEGIAPDAAPPRGCKETVKGNFTLATDIIPKGGQKRESGQEASDNLLVCKLQNGILHDPQNRTGAIVANYQFQFDGPPQAGSIYTGGWSVCPNNTLALGGSTIFYRCQSGGFYNLYDRNIAAQCEAAHIIVSLNEKPTSSSSLRIASSTSSTGVSTLRNGTVVTSSPSLSRASSASATLAPATSAGSSSAPSSSSTGGAVPTRVPRRETFGAVVGILGAALIL